MKRGFTLAEILITLAIVGVVAAMTIPTLIAKINDIVNTNQVAVFNSKVLKGLNLTKTAGDLNDTYTSTYDFLVNGLSKNLKMAKICDSEHIRDCIPYDKIKYELNDKTEDYVLIQNLKTASNLRLYGGFKDIAAFILADGTPVIASYNLNCIVDDGQADTEINSCLAGIYDINGNRKPNKFGSKIENNKTVYVGDIRSFNGANITSCIAKINDVCIYSTAVGYNDIFLKIKNIDPNYEEPKFSAWGSTYIYHWKMAQDYCEKIGAKTPTKADLISIANALYGENTNISEEETNAYSEKTDFAMDTEAQESWTNNKEKILLSLGINTKTSYFQIWSDSKKNNAFSWARVYEPKSTNWFAYDSYWATPLTVCIGK